MKYSQNFEGKIQLRGAQKRKAVLDFGLLLSTMTFNLYQKTQKYSVQIEYTEVLLFHHRRLAVYERSLEEKTYKLSLRI